METILEILLLSIVIIYGNTISGFGATLQDKIWQMWLFPKYPKSILDKPFFCQLCLTFWGGIIILIIKNEFNLPMITVVCLISYFTDVIETLIRLVKDFIINVINLIYSMVDKIK